MKTKFFIYSLIGVFSINGQAATIAGVVKEGQNSISYQINVDKGEAYLNFDRAFDGRIKISQGDLSKVSCEKERQIVKDLAGKLKNVDYKTARAPVRVEFSISDFNFKKVKQLIESNLQTNGKTVPEFSIVSKFLMSDANINFEWNENALSQKATSTLARDIQEGFIQSVMNPDAFEALHESGGVIFKIPVHTAICDLVDGDLKLYFTTKVSTVSDKKSQPTLTFDQIIKVNEQFITASGKLKKALAESYSVFDKGSKSLIISSAALAFSLARQGYNENMLANRTFESIFSSMVNPSTFLPKRLTTVEGEELEGRLTDEVRTTDNTIIVNKEMKIEVSK